MRNILILLTFSLILQGAHAQVFRFIVAKDGSGTDTTLQAAIDKCPENARSIIFIRKGTYFGQTSIGTKTTPGNKFISLIGEDRDGVILTYNKSLSMVTKFEEATTVQVYSKDFYAENITFVNSAGNTGQALALYNAGDRYTLKNCVLKGYQDTYRTKKGTRGYLKSCRIEGAVDYIYAGGTVFFDDCELFCLKGGGYIVAPEDAFATIPKSLTVSQKFLRLGFIFKNCNITAEEGVADGSYFLGRPWNTTAGAFYLNCTLGKHINTKGWKEWNGNETTASFAEYKNKKPDGTLVDTLGRVSWSFQLPQADVDNLLTTTAVYARISTEPYNPEAICIQPDIPGNIRTNQSGYTWNSIKGASGYMILKGGQYLTTTTDTTFVDLTMGPGAITIKTIGLQGQLSREGSVSTGISEPAENKINIRYHAGNIYTDKHVMLEIYNTAGKLIKDFTSESTVFPIELKSGVYIIQLKNSGIKQNGIKLIITPNSSI